MTTAPNDTMKKESLGSGVKSGLVCDSLSSQAPLSAPNDLAKPGDEELELLAKEHADGVWDGEQAPKKHNATMWGYMVGYRAAESRAAHSLENAHRVEAELTHRLDNQEATISELRARIENLRAALENISAVTACYPPKANPCIDDVSWTADAALSADESGNT